MTTKIILTMEVEFDSVDNATEGARQLEENARMYGMPTEIKLAGIPSTIYTLGPKKGTAKPSGLTPGGSCRSR